ncbi:hypothetical protein DPMN_122570 [Dreissena polymorpha]|uniref:Uncharacterized protein n=1 Tax=Dreissena polymorpha TaxID=45954 RepID=A0A9D4JQP0_DREPO|nr:hypothetical protein DPMN_122570 [Dreissena polymorpha]
MLRIRRDLILSSLPKDFLLEPGMNLLRAAPLSSGFFLGGKIQEALTADKDDQLHASLARNNSGQRQGAFKRPASRPPAGPVVKKDKRTNLSSKKPSWNPRSGSNRSTPSKRTSFSQRFSVRNPAKKNKPQLDKRNSKPPVGRGGPPSYQPLETTLSTTISADAGNTSGSQTSAFFTSMASNNFGRLGSFSCCKRPDFSIREQTSFTRPHRTGISTSSYSRVHSCSSGNTGGRKGTRSI